MGRWVFCAVVALTVACASSTLDTAGGDDDDSGASTDGDADSDSDADADGDSDADSDSDTDSDSDADSDSDTDADTDSDAEIDCIYECLPPAQCQDPQDVIHESMDCDQQGDVCCETGGDSDSDSDVDTDTDADTDTSPCSLSVEESFDSSSLPGGWMIDNYDGDGYQYTWTWSSTSNTTGGSGGYWWVDSTPYHEDFDDRLLTAEYDLGECSSVTLSYNHDYSDYDVDDFGYVEIQVDQGGWQTMQSYDSSQDGFASHQVDSYLGSGTSFRFRFRYVGNYDYYWKLDDVRVTGSL
jgi:hypothetical protein